jgi:protein ImuB
VELDRDGKGARRLRLTAFRVDGRTTSLEAGLSAPAAAPAHMLRLLKEKGLERLDLGFGIDSLMLSASRAEPVEARQGAMVGDAREAPLPEALAGLIDRLEAKLGEGAARRPVMRESWIPERSEAWVPARPTAKPAPTVADVRARPILLLDPPEPVETTAELPDGVPAQFRWRRAAHKVVKAAGPERLSPEWWRNLALPAEEAAPSAAHPRESGDPDVLSTGAVDAEKNLDPRVRGDERKSGKHLPRTRDYYRVEDEAGRRFWLFREGLYGREDIDKAPSWWLHGVFA